jgi:predicted amidohydrolase YtcJ
MRFSRLGFGLVALFLISLVTACKDDHADLLVVNGVIHSMNKNSDVFQACAVKDGKIIAVGQTDELKFKFQADTVFDMMGKHLYPGLIDAHCHYYGYAMNINQVSLIATTSWDEVLALTEGFAQNYKGAWILGRGWDQTKWPKQEFPNKKLLDEKFPDRPVFLKRIDGHAAIANQVALDLAGITPTTKIAGGQILKVGGKLTGVLLDNAMEKVDEAIPQPDDKEIAKALIEAEKRLFAVGLTTVDDAGLDLRIINLIDSLQKLGILKIRVYAMANPTDENFDRFLEKGPYKTERMHVCSFKIYADGALGSRGACLLRPYKDLPGERGFLLNTPDYFREMAAKIYKAGFQMNTHCIGDSANRLLLRIYGETLKGKNDRRWRIEHAQIVNPDDLKRFGDNSVIPSVQPLHAMSDYKWAEDRIGKDRLIGAYAYKNLFAQNNRIAFGSDFPVEDINPFLGYYASVARLDLEDFPYGGYMKDQAVGRDTALKAMTIWAAEANFEEKEKGSIEVGKFADFIIVNENLETMVEKQMPYTRILYTFVDGKIVFSSPE